MNLEDIMLTEISQTQKEKHCMISHVESKKVKYIEAESRMVGTRVRRWGKWGNIGQRVQNCNYIG